MSRRDRLRALAEHPTTNPHEAALARAELLRMAGLTDIRQVDDRDNTARVTIEGDWLLVFGERHEEIKEIMLDVFGHAGRIGGAAAIYDAEPEWIESMADALRGCGFEVVTQSTIALHAAP